MAKPSPVNSVKEALAATQECAAACRKCAAACLEEKEIDMLRACIRLDRDCAWICDLTSAYLIGNSSFAGQAAQLCAEICDACAEECEKHADAMDHCRECAEACRRCAEACRSVAGVPA
jgi:hypothetical protein